MSLTTLWKHSRSQLEDKYVHQIIAFAGEGRLKDNSPTSEEFREFLAHVSSEHLCRYVNDCLTNAFPDSGFALQDLVNQIGGRLGFQVKNGRYRGTKSHIGYDGLWQFPNEHHVVVEVKTTDAYRIDSTQIAGYRKRLIAQGDIEQEHSSILIIVGRQDTGDLEAQIRGSRHAWDIRLISIDALVRLMQLKESMDDPQIIERICSILIPQEFTRLDDIIDIVFFAAEEAKQDDETLEVDDTQLENCETQEPSQKPQKPVAFHDACIARFADAHDVVLVKQSRSNYQSPEQNIAVVCSVSKTHLKNGHSSYWFAFHPYQQAFLTQADKGFLVLGCGSADTILVVPLAIFATWLDHLWTTENDERMYWHIRIHVLNGKYLLDRKKAMGRLDVTKYILNVLEANE